ncbi:GNAT family N-acetyltransferase [soil metagenome]
MPSIEIVAARPDDDAAPSMLAALGVELVERYGGEEADQALPLDPAALAAPWGAFFVARLDGTVIGCGGLRHLEPGVGELLRIWVEPAARRRGVGRALVGALEEAAAGLRYRSVRLETGLRQPEAIRLYEGAGYRQIPRYGRWADSPLSVCFEKVLR